MQPQPRLPVLEAILDEQRTQALEVAGLVHVDLGEAVGAAGGDGIQPRGEVDADQRCAEQLGGVRRPWTVADTALLDELVAMLGPVPAEPDAEQPVFIEGGESVAEFVTTSDTWARKAEPELGEDNHETYAHVLVDEAQDVTPMQWRMVGRRGRTARRGPPARPGRARPWPPRRAACASWPTPA